MSAYQLLGVPFGATQEQIRQAYRYAARSLHPDKGGDAQAFTALQAAWEVLRDPQRRAVYDSCSHDHWGQHVDPSEARARSTGCEDVLLTELTARCGSAVVPSCQLVLTCEMCGRPATRSCSLCDMPFCSFCARRQHWRGSHALHWPLVLSPGTLVERLGRRELEAKRLEDDRRLLSSQPLYRSEQQLKELRDFNTAVALAAAQPDHQCRYDAAMGQLYMWTQTPRHVLLAVHLPNGRYDRDVEVEVIGGVLHVGVAAASAAGSTADTQSWSAGNMAGDGGGRTAPPVIYRALAGPLDASAPIEVHRTADGRHAVVVLTKALLDGSHGGLCTCQSQRHEGPPAHAGTWRDSSAWPRLFVGDSVGARSLPPPYAMWQLQDEVVLELPVPWWTRREDVVVEVGEQRLAVAVRGTALELERDCGWWCRAGQSAVVSELCTWNLADAEQQQQQQQQQHPAGRSADSHPAPPNGSSEGSRHLPNVHGTTPTPCSQPGGAGQPGTPCSPHAPKHSTRPGGRCRLLSIVLARPNLAEEERQFKNGVRQDNRACPRRGQHGSGVRFFREDEDAHGLEALLQASSFMLTDGAWLVPRPWDHDEPLVGRWITCEGELPAAAAAHLVALRKLSAAC